MLSKMLAENVFLLGWDCPLKLRFLANVAVVVDE